MSADKDWRKTVGFPINYQSSDDEADMNDVVMRHPVTSSKYLLEDRGDGAEADILGTTPPREQRRGKRGKKYMDMIGSRRSVDGSPLTQQSPSLGSDYVKKHMERKWSRLRERDRKTDLGIGEHRAESLPGNVPAVPTLVESCNRFMCLTSRLKKTDTQADAAEEPQPRSQAHDRVTASRVDFHKTFSMLINMGNVDKGCRRTISREEQVWQNELKDLIWLELQAKIAGRSLARQDAFLCAQRRVTPTVLANITNYRFVNPNPCTYRSKRKDKGTDDLTDGQKPEDSGNETDTEDESLVGCLSLSCAACSGAVGKALREVGTLLDSYHAALALYPSTNAMTHDHPLVATSLFNNRIKAMCLWYNSAVYMRLKMLAVRRMLRTMQLKQRRGLRHLASTDSDGSRPENRPCTVRFNVSNTPSDSNNSDSSALSDLNPETKELEDTKGPTEEPKGPTEDPKGATGDPKVPTEDPKGPTEDLKDRLEEPKDLGHDEKDDKDCVDSGKVSEKNLAETTAPPTPEIVIDSKYGTVESMTSQSSGYTSNSECDVSGQEDDLYEMGSLEDLTKLRLLGKRDISAYREYHREMLKTQGVRRCLMFMNKLRQNVLGKVYLTLEKLDSVKRETNQEYNEDDPVEVFNDAKEEEERTPNAEDDDSRAYEMRRYGCWSEECLAMRLPSYRNHFLLLSSICMEAVHDYLTLRLEDRPQNPSCLTVKQLIHELKEGLDIATEMRAAFVRNVAVALGGHRAGALARQELLVLTHTYDETVDTALNQYLSYLRKISEVEHMPRWGLRAEWAFTARLAKRVKCVALQAPVAFSEIACNQLNRIVNRFKEKFAELTENSASLEDTTDRYTIYMLCRETQQIYSCEREAALQAAVWARALAARLLRAPRPYCRQRAAIVNSLMALRDVIAEQTKFILAQSDVPAEEVANKEMEAVMSRVRELLLQVYRLGFELHKELYQFAQAPYKLHERRVRQRPASLQPERPRVEYRRRRPETMLVHETFNPMVHKELHRFLNSSRPQPPNQRRSTQSSPPKCRVKLARSESIGEDGEGNALDDKLFEGTADGQTHSSIERILSGDLPLIEEVELRSSVPGSTDPAPTCDEEEWAKRVARAIVEFARCWMTFVLKRCDTGRGRRPRWASQGLEFLMLACDPCNTKYLTDEEFEELKKEMDGCISHVIGTRPVAPRTPESGQSTPVPGRRRPIHTSISTTANTYVASNPVGAGDPAAPPAEGVGGGGGGGVPTPPTPPSEPDPLLSFHTQTHHAHRRRVLEAIKELDTRRDAALRARRALGRVAEAAAAAAATAGPKLRHVHFKWQRGLKIGAGTFGKVYTVVTESGQLLAMKELSIGAGDRRALQRAANELRVLEGVIHPHLVRYYGCEVHREEMLIFMELCVEGSLEALIATAGALAEGTIRRYTKQLVSAVQELHSRSIVHRDIKSGNIFLTNEGHCLKLGDFGCAVKIRANTTAAGELQGCVGTQAYMAPEVFMKSSGHGRAADIWSLGCVVTEMASGKRPWPQYDSNYQIMFVVGMGGRPEIPPTLSEEGRAFCVRCLTHEPERRARIDELAMHHFLMVKSDDDCKCQPAYLIT